MKHVPVQRNAGQPIKLIHNERIAKRTIIAFTDASIRKHGSGVGVASRSSDDGYVSQTTLRAKHAATRDINELEMSSIFIALETTDHAADIVVYTDSQTAIDQVTGATATKKYDRLARLIRRVAESRRGSASICKVKAHSGNEGNELADALAAEGTLSAYAIDLPRDGDDLSAWRERHVGEEHAMCVVREKRTDA